MKQSLTKFIDRISDSTLQLAFKKLPFVKFCCNIKDDYPQLSLDGILKYSFPLSNYLCLWGKIFFIYYNQKNILNQIEGRSDMNQAEFHKYMKQCHSSNCLL